MTRLLTLCICVALCSGVSLAQAPAPPAETKPPALTIEQRLTLDGLKKDITIAQLSMQAAQAAYAKAVTEIQRQVAAVQVEGYIFDPDTYSYTAKPKKDPPEKAAGK